MPSFPPEPQWIAAAVETPLVVALAWMIHVLRRSIVQGAERPERPEGEEGAPSADTPSRRRPESLAQQRAALERTRDDLAAFKLEVARTYVPLSLIRDVDGRLTAHLIRIEQKLDEATRAAHSTAAQVRVLAEDR
jgi:hypothetical protein